MYIMANKETRTRIEHTKRAYCMDGHEDKEKAVFDRYSELIKLGNDSLKNAGVKSPISITPIYEQVAEEFYYSSYRSVQRIIRKHLSNN